MEWMLFLAFVVATGSIGFGAVAFEGAQASVRTRARRRAADRCGITDVAMGHGGTVSGRHGALRVSLETVDSERSVLRVVVAGLVEGVEITSSAARAATGPHDVAIGDPSLDGPLVLCGPPATVRALFTADVRVRMRRMLALGGAVHVRGGALVAELRGGMTHDASLAARIQVLLEAAQGLAPGTSDESRLAEIARRDPIEDVRAKALESLATEAAGHALTRPALRDATRDASHAIRLQAATALGDEGREVLYALASDPAVADAIAVGAVEALGSHLTLPRAQPLLEAAAADLRVPLARALLRWMGRGDAAEAGVVASLLARRLGRDSSAMSAKGGEIAVAAVEALAETGVPAAEGPLIEALRSGVPGVPPAAARGLGRVGTARAVPPLRDAEERGGETRRAAREAIALVQSRLTGATPGQVSLAAGEAGQVSVAGAMDGRVSLGTDEP
ncbi:MAG: HEAT repeat domain-containing protein [Vicinamibacteria bacterium]